MLPTGPSFTFKVATKLSTQPACLSVFLLDGAKGPAADEALLGDVTKKAIARLILSGVSRGKARDIHFDLIDETSRKNPEFRRVYVAGLGPVKKVSAEGIRQSAGAIARAAKKHRVADMTIALPQFERGSTDLTAGAIAEAIVGGLLLAGFDFTEYKGTAAKRDAGKEASRTFTILCSPESADAVKRGIERGRIIAEGQNFARTIASRPGNVINPPSLAKVAQDLAKEVGLTARVLDEKQMQKLGMGGILAVGAGSIVTPPRMIVLEHAPKSAKSGQPLLVIGKAITFDTGGISIKPADKMGRMIFDKCGGMAVLGLMYAVAKLKLPVRVVGILAAAENHISDTAYRPGDILKMYNGVTVEVTNTDAEGRLVLADALAWGIEQYKPSAVVNLATLTGGVVVALGKTMAGIMANDDGIVKELDAAAGLAGEKLWRLPIGEDQREYIKSEPADIVNSGGREGHPLQGGAFLSFFVPGGAGEGAANSDGGKLVPWAHLDIAGVADTEKDLPYYAKGATGWGVRTLVEWVSAK
ncbi:leucyl aminopeptidase family protein [Humisphaera borealis]|uniref:Probable cytosol aminopeptidase n=1 Tax=Humisphaera borealis TaxID=2807512 RepID=A0A7M2WWM6_9BACT|nr:leucyl aminopeptidase [Humisphaera borealis]QOV89799.1 leucyl aminopeptidase [Humisphaera borealis]